MAMAMQMPMPMAVVVNVSGGGGDGSGREAEVREEVLENQARVREEWAEHPDEEQRWVDARTGKPRTRESVELPFSPPGSAGWVWKGDWKCVVNEKGADQQGWMLVNRGQRRRRWVRIRERVVAKAAASASAVTSGSPGQLPSFSASFSSSVDRRRSEERKIDDQDQDQSFPIAIPLKGGSLPATFEDEDDSGERLDPVVKHQRLRNVIIKLLQEAAETTHVIKWKSEMIGSKSDSQNLRTTMIEFISETRAKLYQIDIMFGRLEMTEKFIRATPLPNSASSASRNSLGGERSAAQLAAAKAARAKLNNDYTCAKTLFDRIANEALKKERNNRLSSPASYLNFQSNNNGANDIDGVNNSGIYMTRNERTAMEERMLQQMVLQDEAKLNEAILRERNEEWKDIYKKTSAIHEAMHDLKSLTEAQGESIDTIGTNTVMAHNAAKKAVYQIHIADQYQASRSCIIC